MSKVSEYFEPHIYFPNEFSTENITAFLMIIIGILSVYVIEKYSANK